MFHLVHQTDILALGTPPKTVHEPYILGHKQGFPPIAVCQTNLFPWSPPLSRHPMVKQKSIYIFD